MSFHGFDHVDTRVPSLKAVEPFYDKLMPRLGLTRKRTAYVDAAGEWCDTAPDGSYNTVEFIEEPEAGHVPFFMGFIEREDTARTFTRIAFRVSPEELADWPQFLTDLGARKIEVSEDMAEYPAIFFEDPVGTKLEVVARRPRRA